MPWARFDERFPGHRRIRKLSDAAFRLHVSAVCWSCEYLTDGHVPAHDIDEVADVRRPEKAAEELVRAGRWHLPGHDCPSEWCRPITDGWLIHDFLDYNPSRAEVEEKREKDAERKRRGRTSGKRGSPSGVRTDSGRTDGGVTPESFRTDPVLPNGSTTRPEPVVPTTSGVAPINVTENPSAIVKAYVDGATSAGHPRPGQPLRGKVGKDAKRLLTVESIPFDTLLAAARRMGERGWDSLDRELQRSSAEARPRTAHVGYTDADRSKPGGEITTDEWRQGA